MKRTLRTLLLPLAVLGLGLSACDDPSDIDDHPAAEGVAIVTATEELYRYMLEDGTPVPTFTLGVGAHDVAIVLLDHDGQPLAHAEEEGEEEDEIDVTVADAAILTWTPEAETGQAHEHVEIHGELNAHEAGSTTMEICLIHAGHCDFEVVIPVAVDEAQ